METESTTISYIRGNKGSLGTRIFFKGVIYLLVYQMIFFGAPISFTNMLRNAPEPIRLAYENAPESVKEAIKHLDESLELKEARAAGEVEFVSVIDPDNGA